MPATPYISPAAFAAHPTYLDMDDLRSGSAQEADQTAELANLLLMASQWADNEIDQPFGAHVRTQRCRARIDRSGILRLHPDRTPVIAVASVGYGLTPTALTTVSGTGAWVEDDRNILLPLDAGSASWSGSLQFGRPASGDVFVQATYTAGYVTTTLASPAVAGAMSLTVSDPTGIVPGGSYRIWEPGSEETVTVADSWTPPAATVPPAAAAVTLAAPALSAHAAGHDFSGLPADVRLAVVNYAVSLLMRPDTASEDAYPDTPLASGTRRNDPRRDGSGLVAEAARILSSYGRVR
ncbi:hypothetical protein AB0H73_14700 [Streptomyces olivoreticuli]